MPVSLVGPQPSSVVVWLQGIPERWNHGIALLVQLPQLEKSGTQEASKTVARLKNEDLHCTVLTAFSSVEYRCKCFPQGIKEISNDQGLFAYNILFTLIFPVRKSCRNYVMNKFSS